MQLAKKPYLLSQEFNDILLELEESNQNYFITGKAGTGKSTLLNLFKKTSQKKVVVLAPTGIAALNVRGQTIHSFFGFPPRMLQGKDLQKRPRNQVFKKVETIIIDEISMVRADMLDGIDIFLRNNRGVQRPFGGVQMIFFGDLFQLPPIIADAVERQILNDRYNTPYFFSAKALVECSIYSIELTQVFRQDEVKFIKLLDALRVNNADEEDIEMLNSRFVPIPTNDKFYIRLSARNYTADRINSVKLAEISSEKFVYQASITGDFNLRNAPVPSLLELKAGAQVMFVKNDPEKRFVNGTIGEIVLISSESICVRIPKEDDNFEEVELFKSEWENVKYKYDPKTKKFDSETTGSFVQYPIKLAWALTIHKSQGQTFEKVIIDLEGGAFEAGQTYVALSRCTTLGGIILTRPLRPKDIWIDERICEYYQQIK